MPKTYAAIFYVAVLERDDEGFSVFFPDIPGCTSGGATMAEAVINAGDALEGHLGLEIERGAAPPVARGLDEIPVDPLITEAGRVVIRFDVPETAVRVNITLPEPLLSAVDDYARAHGFTRSGLLGLAVREHIRPRVGPK
jgi:predicted RNase H-like HicB family nuclease